MEKHIVLKRLLFGLLIIGSVYLYASFHQVSAEDNCSTWEENMADYQGDEHCWTCQIFQLFYNSSNVVARQINATLETPLKKMIYALGILWIGIQVLIFLSDVTDAPDVMAFLGKIGTMMFKVGIAVCFLSGGAALTFDYIVEPVLTDAVSLATGVLGNGSLGAGVQNMSDCGFSGQKAGSAGEPMGKNLGQSLNCMMQKVSTGMASSQAIAQGLRCGSTHWREFDFGIFGSFTVLNPLMCFVGCSLGLLFWFIPMLFLLSMLDVIFRIGLILGLLPIFIAAWVFPITASYAKKGWDLYFSSCMVFFVMAIVLCMVVTMIDLAWGTGNPDVTKKFFEYMKESSYVKAWDEVIDKSGYMSLICVYLSTAMGIGLAMKADKVASKLGGGDFDPPPSCGIRAVLKILEWTVDALLLLLTILTFGATTFCYFFKALGHVAKVANKIAKVAKKIADAAKKAKKALNKVKNSKLAGAMGSLDKMVQDSKY